MSFDRERENNHWVCERVKTSSSTCLQRDRDVGDRGVICQEHAKSSSDYGHMHNQASASRITCAGREATHWVWDDGSCRRCLVGM